MSITSAPHQVGFPATSQSTLTSSIKPGKRVKEKVCDDVRFGRLIRSRHALSTREPDVCRVVCGVFGRMVESSEFVCAREDEAEEQYKK